MREILINILEGSHPYLFQANEYVLGRQYESEATKVIVTRPEIERGRTCLCIVKQGDKTIDNIPIVNDTFIVTSFLSQNKNIELGFVFYDEKGYIQTTEPKVFYFAPALRPFDFMPIGPEASKIIFDLMAQNLTSLEFDPVSRNLKAKNMTGDVKNDLFLPFIKGATLNGDNISSDNVGTLNIELNLIDGGLIV